MNEKFIEQKVAENVLTTKKPAPMHCSHCGKVPGYIKAIRDGDEVYKALECDCKQTPYMRSSIFVDATWESITHALTPKEAYEIAKRESPGWIIIVPKHTK